MHKSIVHSWHLLCMVGCLMVTLSHPVCTFAQSGGVKLSVSFKEKTLSSILDYITKNSDYSISYTNEVRNYPNKMVVSFDEATVEKAVQDLLYKTPFTYSVNGKSIRVFKMETAKQGNFIIKGIVKDTEGEVIPNATIRLKGLKQGTIADTQGQFSLSTNNGSGEIVISAIGYSPITLKYSNGHTVNAILKEEGNQLGEVAVIAYGSRTRRDMLGSVSSLKGDALKDVPSSSLETLLQGKMAGVDVSNLSGQPGGNGSKIVIRGFSSLNQQGVNDGSPLFVVDGVPVQSSSTYTGGINPLSSLDPSNIESVEVLKDATSASLYGSRAGNGVILITTKKGKSGKAEFNASVSQSFSWLPSTPTQLRGNGERLWNILLAKNQRVGEYD